MMNAQQPMHRHLQAIRYIPTYSQVRIVKGEGRTNIQMVHNTFPDILQFDSQCLDLQGLKHADGYA